MRHATLAALLAAAACAPHSRNQPMDPPSSTPPAQASHGPVPLRRLDAQASAHFRTQSGMDARGEQVVRDAAAWSALWPRLGGPGSSTPAVDFGREMVLVAAMGTRPTGGYTVSIESVDDQGGEWVAHVVERRPGPRCGAIQAITSPADVVVVPRTGAAIRWDVRGVVTDCP